MTLKISRKDEAVTVLKAFVKADSLCILLLMQIFAKRG